MYTNRKHFGKRNTRKDSREQPTRDTSTADSLEAKKFLKSQQDSEESRPSEVATGGVKRSGLAGIVGSIGKKQKMGVLDKSKLDWNSFVTQEGISEELKTHNKGKEG